MKFPLIAFITFAGGLISHADLLVYEPFDYAAVNDASFGRVAGRNGGLGFAGPWVDCAGQGNEGEAFVYDQRGNPEDLYGGDWGADKLMWDGVVDNLPGMGGYAGVSDWSGESDRMNSKRKLAKSAGAMAAGNGGVLWLSAVWHPANYAYLIDGDKKWRALGNMKFWWNRADLGQGPRVTKGDLTVGYGAGPDCIGPEYGFSMALEKLYKGQPVLLIKSCWGGKSLYGDYCSPTAAARRDGRIGPYYIQMMNQVHQVLDSLDKEFPEFAGNVFTIDTRPLQREVAESPRADGSHWNNNGETLYLIGKGMGDGMVKMLTP